MPTAKSLLGRRAEELTAAELVQRGCKIVATNYRCRYGEIDIIARTADTLIFVEVRSRRSNEPAYPAESVNEKKQSKLILAAQTYLQENEPFTNCSCRFDVSEVRFEKGKPVSVEIIENAFVEK